MLATPVHHVPTGADWPHEVKWDGVRRAGRHDPRRRRTRLISRNENDVTVAWPELSRAAARRPRPAGRRRGDRAQRARAARLPGARRTGCTCATPRGRAPGSPTAARDATWSSTCSASTARTSPPSRWGSGARCCAASALGALDVAGAGGVRRRRRCCSRPPCSRGSRGSSASGCTSRYVFGERSRELAEVRPPPPRLVRRRRLAAAGGHDRPARRAAGRASRPRRGWSTAAGSAAASPARPAARRWAP